MFTQPQMYTAIARKEPVFKMYCKQLLDEGVVTQEDVDALSKRVLPACLRCALSRVTVEDL